MSDAARNKQVVLEFLDAYTTFDPAVYERYLTEHPHYQVGLTQHPGREGFAEVARYARLLYPTGQDRRTIHHVVSEGDAVAVFMTVDATTNAGKSYTNDYAVFFVLEDGRIAKQIEM